MFPQTFLNPNSVWWHLGRDFLVPIGIAVLAGFIAYNIFVKETNRDKKKEQDRLDQLRDDKLLYFSTLVNSILQNSRQQQEHLSELINSIKNDGISFHLMIQVPLYDHKRVVELINLEDYILSFANYFHTDRINAILEFQQIIASIDYLYSTFTHLIDVHLRAQNFDDARKIRFAHLFASAYEKLQVFFVIFERADNNYSKEFFQCFETFSSSHQGNNSDISLYHFKFFKPFHAFFVKYILEKQPIRQEIFDFVAICKNAIQLYTEIEFASKDLNTDYSEDLKHIIESIGELQNNSKRLLSTFLKD